MAFGDNAAATPKARQVMMGRLKCSYLDVEGRVLVALGCHGGWGHRGSSPQGQAGDDGAPGCHIWDLLGGQQLRCERCQVLLRGCCEGLPARDGRSELLKGLDVGGGGGACCRVLTWRQSVCRQLVCAACLRNCGGMAAELLDGVYDMHVWAGPCRADCWVNLQHRLLRLTETWLLPSTHG